MHHINPDTITLAKGGHDTRDDGVCLMEAVAWWAEETHTDRPACVSPVLGEMGRALNDRFPAAKRQQLRQFITMLPGTAGDGLDGTRGCLALDWLIRTFTPAWLDLAGLTAEAAALRDLRRIVDLAAAQSAGPVVHDAAAKAAAAGAAAWAAAWAAARAAARAAAWAALKPTVGSLQDSAIALYGAMINPALVPA